jgi:hypothetical protein
MKATKKSGAAENEQETQEYTKLIQALGAITTDPTTAPEHEKVTRLNYSVSEQDRSSELAFWEIQKDSQWGKTSGTQEGDINEDQLTATKVCLASIAQIEKKTEAAIKKLPEGDAKRRGLEEGLKKFHESDGYKSWKTAENLKYNDALLKRKAVNEQKLQEAKSTGIGTKIDQNAKKIGGNIGVALLTVPAVSFSLPYQMAKHTIKDCALGGFKGGKLGIEAGKKTAEFVEDKTKKMFGENTYAKRMAGNIAGKIVGGACGVVVGSLGVAGGTILGAVGGAAYGCVVDGPNRAMEKSISLSKTVGENTRGFGIGLVASAVVTPVVAASQKARLEFKIEDDQWKIKQIWDKLGITQQNNYTIGNNKTEPPQTITPPIAPKQSTTTKPVVIEQTQEQTVANRQDDPTKFDEVKKLLSDPHTQTKGIEEGQKMSKPISQQQIVKPNNIKLGDKDIPTLNPDGIKIEGLTKGEFMIYRPSEHGLPAIAATYEIQQDGKAKCTQIILPPYTQDWKRETVQDKDGVDVIQMKHTDGRVSVLCTAEEFQKCESQMKAKIMQQSLAQSPRSSTTTVAMSEEQQKKLLEEQQIRK